MTLVLTCVAGFMLILDMTIVNIALPSLQAGLGVRLDTLEWAVNAYALAFGALLLVAGMFVDRVPRRLAFAAGVGGFSTASLLCGLARTATELNLARGLQGAAGALLSASALALIGQEYTGRARDRALGVFAAASGAATAVGPLVGGALVEASGWRTVFLINLPIGLVLLTLTGTLPRTRPASGAPLWRLDWPGAATFGGGLLAVSLWLTRGPRHGWAGPLPLTLLGGGLILLAGFVAVEHVRRVPMLELALFRRPRFVAAILTSFAARAGTFGAAFFLTLYLQGVLQLGPVTAGLWLIPLTVMIVIGALLSGGPLPRYRPAVAFAAGYALLAAGLLAVFAVDDDSGLPDLLPALLLLGLGTGLLTTPVLSVAMGELPPERVGVASAVNTAFLPLGTAAGIAVLSAVFSGPRSAPAVAAAPAEFVTGLHRAMLVAAAVVVVAGAASLLLLARPLARGKQVIVDESVG